MECIFCHKIFSSKSSLSTQQNILKIEEDNNSFKKELAALTTI